MVKRATYEYNDSDKNGKDRINNEMQRRKENERASPDIINGFQFLKKDSALPNARKINMIAIDPGMSDLRYGVNGVVKLKAAHFNSEAPMDSHHKVNKWRTTQVTN